MRDVMGTVSTVWNCIGQQLRRERFVGGKERRFHYLGVQSIDVEFKHLVTSFLHCRGDFAVFMIEIFAEQMHLVDLHQAREGFAASLSTNSSSFGFSANG